MKAVGPKHERETIITFNEENSMVEVWTASQNVYRRLVKRVGVAYVIEDGERHASFRFPKKFLDLPRKKRERILTPAQRQALAFRMVERKKLLGQNA